MFSQEADDDEASEGGEQEPSAKTLFGAPAQNPPVRNDQAQGPWSNSGGAQDGEATPQTLAPWAMRKGEGVEDQRSTLVGMPKLSRKKRPDPLNPPAARSATKKRRPARQKTQLGGPNAADAKKAAAKAVAQAAQASSPEPKSSRKKDDVRHTYMGLPALDLDADDELAALVMETFADDLELPSKEESPAKAARKPSSKVRHTTQIPALFAAQSLESEEIEDDGKETAPPWQPPRRSKTRDEIKPSPVAEKAPEQSAEIAEGQLFKFPARKSLRSQDRSANRTTLTGVPVVSNASKAEENDNDSSAPGQYILRKKDLSRAPEKIRINALLKSPSRESEPKDNKTTIGISRPKPDGGLGATNTTMRLSVPVVGSEDGAKTELDPRLGQRKPSTTMRMSVPVVGNDDGKKVKLTPSPAPGQQVASSSAVAVRGAKAPSGRRGLSAAPAVTARLSVPAAVKKHMESQAAQEDSADTIIQPAQSRPDPHDDEGFTSADTLQTDNIEPLLQAQRAAQQAQRENVGFLETQEFSPPDEISSDDDDDMFDIDVAEEPVRSVTPGYGEPPKILSSATSQPDLSRSPAASQPAISQPQRSSGPLSVSGPPSSSASIPAQTARVPAQAPVTQPSPVLAGGSPVASDAAVRASALLGGGLMLLVPVFYIAALSGDGVKALPPLAMMSIFFPALGGLIAMLSGVIKFHPVMRATILTLVGSISLTLFALADLVPANAYGDTLSRLLVAAAIMLPVGLVWRARYPASGLSRIVVALGMVLLLVNYFLPTEDGALRLMSLLGSLSETPLISATALIPLALLVPSLGAFAGAKTTGGGLIWTALLCVWLLAMCVVGALVVPEAALLAFAGGGLGLMAATLCASMGFGDLLGWLTLPEEES